MLPYPAMNPKPTGRRRTSRMKTQVSPPAIPPAEQLCATIAAAGCADINGKLFEMLNSLALLESLLCGLSGPALPILRDISDAVLNCADIQDSLLEFLRHHGAQPCAATMQRLIEAARESGRD